MEPSPSKALLYFPVHWLFLRPCNIITIAKGQATGFQARVFVKKLLHPVQNLGRQPMKYYKRLCGAL